jgi:hypothetical protein
MAPLQTLQLVQPKAFAGQETSLAAKIAYLQPVELVYIRMSTPSLSFPKNVTKHAAAELSPKTMCQEYYQLVAECMMHHCRKKSANSELLQNCATHAM